MFVFASVVDPTVLAFIIGNLMSLIFIPIPVRLLCNQLLYNRKPPKNMKCCNLNDPNGYKNRNEFYKKTTNYKYIPPGSFL